MGDEETCSRGNERATCCHPRAVDNLRAIYGDMWSYHWREFDDRVAVIADALGLDPHALDDNVQDRGWEYHDTGIERAIAQGVYALLHPDDTDPDATIIVEEKQEKHLFRVNSRGNCLNCGGSRSDSAHYSEEHP